MRVKRRSWWELEREILKSWDEGANWRKCTNTVLASVSKTIKCLRTKIVRQRGREKLF